MNRWISMAAAVACAIVTPQEVRSQSTDTARTTVDSAKRRVDSTRKAGNSGRKPTDMVGRSAARQGAIATNSDDPIQLVADLSQRTLTVLSGEEAVKSYSVAIGRSSKPTPTGTFRIRKIVWNPAWIPPNQPWAKGRTPQGPGDPENPMKVAKIFFQEPDYYIHGTGDVESLGSADSHGCIRMSPDEVAELARLLMEKGGNPQEEGWFSRVIHLRWKTHTVTLPNPIQLTITR